MRPCESSATGFKVPAPINVVLEVQQHLGRRPRFRCVAMQATDGMVPGDGSDCQGGPISVPVGRGTLGRVMNVIGEPVDQLGPIQPSKTLPIHRPAAASPYWFDGKRPRQRCLKLE